MQDFTWPTSSTRQLSITQSADFESAGTLDRGNVSGSAEMEVGSDHQEPSTRNRLPQVIESPSTTGIDNGCSNSALLNVVDAVGTVSKEGAHRSMDGSFNYTKTAIQLSDETEMRGSQAVAKVNPPSVAISWLELPIGPETMSQRSELSGPNRRQEPAAACVSLVPSALNSSSTAPISGTASATPHGIFLGPAIAQSGFEPMLHSATDSVAQSTNLSSACKTEAKPGLHKSADATPTEQVQDTKHSPMKGAAESSKHENQLTTVPLSSSKLHNFDVQWVGNDQTSANPQSTSVDADAPLASNGSSSAVLPSELQPSSTPAHGKFDSQWETQQQPLAQVQTARIIQSAAKSEMQVGLRTDSFGAVQVHTKISEKQVEVEVGSERGDLKGFISSELPALQNSLQQHDLRLNHLRSLLPAYSAPSDAFSGNAGGRSSNPRRNMDHHSSRFSTTQPESGETLIESAAGLSVRV
jgi:hypothetical protein